MRKLVAEIAGLIIAVLLVFNGLWPNAAIVVCVFKTAPGGGVAKKLLISLSRVPSPLVQVFSHILTFILPLRCPFA